VSEDVPK
jgi:pSer/pThr/pTyr-binding forkhead associated (FHA) protein